MIQILGAILAKHGPLPPNGIGAHARAVAALLLALGASLPAQAEVPLGCQVSALNPVSFVGTVAPCDGLLVISQADFDAVGSTNRSDHEGSEDGSGEFEVILNSQIYGVADWYTGNITDMAGYFARAEEIGDISGWDTSNASDMSYMFYAARSFDQNIGNWDVSKVVDMSRTFSYARAFNQDLSGWEVSSLVNANFMFFEADVFNSSLDWGTSTASLKEVHYIFGFTDNFEGIGLVGWDTSSIEDMSYMFRRSPAFNADIGGWDVSSVTDMNSMLADAVAFNQDLSAWQVTRVTDMSNMFDEAIAFNSDIGGWDVSSVTSMNGMFQLATAFNQDLSGWDVSRFSSEPRNFDDDANPDWVENAATLQPNWGAADSNAPTAQEFFPVKDATAVRRNEVLILTFDESVEANEGQISIFRDDDDTLFENIDVTGEQVEFIGKNASFSPTNAFEFEETYYVTIPSGAIQDVSGDENAFLGITEADGWRFTIEKGVSASQSDVSIDPADGSISLTSAATVRVEALDEDDNSVSGRAADIEADATNGAVVGPFSETATGSGIYEAELTATQAGETQVTITMDGVILSPTVSATFVESIVVSASVASLQIEEGSEESFDLSLAAQPSDTVTVTARSNDSQAVSLSADGGGTWGTTADLNFAPSSWTSAQTLMVRGVEDDDGNDATGVEISFEVTLASAALGDYESQVPSPVTVDVEDTIVVAGLVVSTLSVSMVEGGSDSFTVGLDTPPSGDVTVTVSSNDAAAAAVSTDGGTTQAGSVDLTFAITDYAAKTITVVGLGDDDSRDETSSITLTASGGGYDGAAQKSVDVTVTDTSIPAVVLTGDDLVNGALSLDETASSIVNVALATEPSGTVTLSLGSSSYAVEVLSTTGNSSTVSFDASNWGDPQSVTISAVEDSNATSETGVVVSFDPEGAEYDSVSVATQTVTVDVTDDDTPTTIPIGCQVSSINPQSFVGAVDPCNGLLVIAQADFDAVGSSSTTSGGDESFQISIAGYDEPFGVDQWYTGNITDMSSYFRGTNIGDGSASDPIGDISNWDTSKVTDMSYMFYAATSFDQYVGGWDVSNVSHMSYMFYDADSFNQTLDWGNKTASVKSMESMFELAPLFEGYGLDGWDTSSVENMREMFRRALVFVGDIEQWNVSKVTNMYGMFSNAWTFNKDRLDWDTSNVENMGNMFYNARDFNGDISSWNTSAVDDMSSTFSGAQSFNQYIGGWDVSSVGTFVGMFSGASAFNQDLSEWSVSSFQNEPTRFNDDANATWVANDAYQPNWGGQDLTAPTAEAFFPSNGAIGVDQDAVLVLTFSEGVEANSGEIDIFRDDGSSFATIDVNSDAVAFNGADMELTPSSAFEVGQTYYVIVPSGVVQDVSEQSNAFEGILDAQTWRFSIEAGVDVNASQVSVTPADTSVYLTSSAMIRVSLRDENNNPVAGQVADLSAEATNGALLGDFTETGDGVYEAELTSSQPVTTEVTVTMDGVTILPTVSVTFIESIVVSASATDLDIVEGDTGTFTLSLASQPSDTVTVRARSNDYQAVSVSADAGTTSGETADLVFDANNWNSAQTVTVVGVSDDDQDDESDVEISFEVTLASAATEDYEVQVPDPVRVDVTDTSAVGVTVSKPSVSMDEGDTDSFTVVLNTPPSGDVTVTVSTDDVDAVSVSKDGGVTQEASVVLTFSNENWNAPQTVTATGVADNDTNDETPLISFTVAGHEYDGTSVDPVSASVTDTGVAGVTVSKTGVSMDEGSSDSFTVVLDTEPSGDVTVTVSTDDVDAASVSKDGGVTQGASIDLTFTAADWDSAQTVTITGVADDDTNNEAPTISFSVVGHEYEGMSVDPVSASVTDISVAGVTVSKSSVSMDEGGTDSFTVVLDTEPSGEVTVTVSTDDVDAASVSNDGGVTQGSSIDLTFTTADWDSAQTVTVTGVADDDTDNETPTISFAVVGHEYEGMSVASVSASVTDTSVAGVAVSKSSVSMSEGGSDSFTVVLDTEPSGEVTVTVSTDDVGAASVSKDGGVTQGSSVDLTFTTADWDSAQTVTVTGVADDDTSDETPTISFAVVGHEYEGMSVASVSASVTDTSVAGVAVSKTGVSMDEGGSDSFTVVLDTEPSGEVTVTVSTDDVDAASVSKDGGVTQGSSIDLTFTTADWDSAQTVTVTGVADDDTSDETPTISFAVVGHEYEGMSVASVSASVTDTSVAGVAVSKSSVSMSEGGSDSFTVVLDTEPSGEVTVTVSTDDVGAASVSKDGGVTQGSSVDLTFTTADWDSAQTVTVTGVADDDTNDEAPTISFAVVGHEYEGMSVASVSASVADKDGPGVTVSKSGVSMDEGSSDSFTVVLDTEPSGDVTVTVSTDDVGAASVSKDGGVTQGSSVDLTFTTADWDSAQTVTVTGVADDDTNDETPTISFAVVGHEYEGMSVGSVSASVTDISVAGVTVSKSSVSMDEGGTDSFTVVLDTEPSGDVTVTVSTDDVGAASVSKDGGVTQGSSVDLTFTAADWDSAQTVTVTGVADDDTNDEAPTISFSVVGHEYEGMSVDPVSASVTDISVAGVTVSKSSVSMDEGGTDSFTVVLDTEPSGDVTVTVSTDDVGAASVSKDGGVTQGASVDLTFTTADWDSAQTVTVTGVADDDTSDETPTISFAVVGHEYEGMSVDPVSASVTDISVAGVAVSKSSVSMSEGGSDSFTVVLDTEPSGEVTVTVSTDDVDAASVSKDGGVTQGSSIDLTFTTADWDSAQTVTVTGVADDDTNDEAPTISFAVVGHEYEGMSVASVSASVADKDGPGVTVSKSGVSMDEGSSDSFTVVLDTEPSGDVTVTVSTDDVGAASVSKDGGVTQGSSVDLTFTTADWDSAQTVTVTGVADDDTNDETPTISFAVVGHEYEGMSVGSVSASVTDISVAGVTVSKSSVSMDEGGTDSFTVVLDTEPSGEVTVTVSTDDVGAASVSKDGGVTQGSSVDLTFTTADWDSAQTVTITGVADDDTNNEAPTISFSVVGHEYEGMSVDPVSASVTDISVAGVTVSKSSVSMDEGGTDSFTVVLDTEPSGDVTVTVSTDDVGAASVSKDGGVTQGSSVDLTFTTADWDSAQTVTVTGVADDDTSDETPTISFAVVGHEYEGMSVDPVSASVTDISVAGVAVSKSSVSMSEGGSDSFTVVLDTEPSGDVTVTVSTDDVGAASVSKDGGVTQGSSVDLTFTTADWDSAQTVTVTGVADDDTDNETPTISFAVVGHEYEGMSVASVSASVTDTSVAGVAVSKSSVSMSEGGSDSFTVVLDTEPSGEVTVTVSTDDVGAASVSKDGGVTQGSSVDLTFTTADWDSAQTVTVTGVADDDTNDEAPTISFAVVGHEYEGMSVASVSASVADKDGPGVTVSKSGVSMDEGSSDSFTVVLDTEPSGEVTVTVSTDDVGAASVSKDGGVTQGSSVDLTFTTADWDSAQTVTVTGVADDDTNDETPTISFAVVGHEYEGMSVSSVSASVTDTSVAGVTVSKTGVSMDEGGSDSFTVVLDTEPSGEVTVTVSTDDVGAASVSKDGGVTQGSSVDLTFTAADWDSAQTVTITGVADDDTNDEAPTISFAVVGHEYEGMSVGSVSASVTDTGVAGVTVSKTGVSMSEGSNDSFTVVLDIQPSADVTVTVSSDEVDAATVSDDDGVTQSDAVGLIFTAEDWNVAQTVTVTAVDNSGLGASSATLTLTTSSTDSAYDALADQSLAVTIADDESATLVTSVSTLTLDEGGTATFTVALGGAPSGEVSVALGTSNANALTVAESSLTFDATNWSVPQVVSLTAPDNTGNGDATVEVSLIAGGAEFDGVSSSVRVTIEDNDLEVPAEDTGALVSSIATSEVMGTQLGNLISDAVSGGISPPTRTYEAPSRMRRTLYGLTAADYDPEAYNSLQVLSAREGEDGFTLVDWFSVGLSQASLDASLSGDGAFAYAMAGRELAKTRASVSGLLYGVETSSWDYEDETDVDRTGFSLGYYSAQQSDGLTFSGSAILTLSQNDFVSVSGATGDANSQRLIFKGNISGARALQNRQGLLTPYVSLMYATESLEAFTFSDGTTSDDSTTHIGRFGLGVEYATEPNALGSRFLVRGELSQVFGAQAVTLSDGEVYSPNEDPVGSVTFGWSARTGTDTTAQIELTFGELGNSEREEIRLDGTVDRRF